jgi:hypothetical protein
VGLFEVHETIGNAMVLQQQALLKKLVWFTMWLLLWKMRATTLKLWL